MIFSFEIQAGQQCGTQTCDPGLVCQQRKNILTGKLDLKCVPGGDSSANNSTADVSQCNRVREKCIGRVVVEGDACRCVEEEPSSQSDSAGNSNGAGAACYQTYVQLKEQCDGEYQGAAHSCDEKNDSGLTGIGDTAADITSALAQGSSALASACSKWPLFVQSANAAMAAYRLNCNNSISSCRSACAQVKRYIKENSHCLISADVNFRYDVMAMEAEEDANRCNNFVNKVQGAQQSIQSFGITATQAAQCQAMSSGSPGMAEYCKNNPNVPVCASAQSTDCSNPANTSKICVCQRTNNRDPMCLNGQNAGGEVAASGGSIDSSSRLAQGNTTEDFGGDIPNLPSIAAGQGGSGTGSAVEGSQGGGGVGSAGGGSGAGAGGSGGGGSSGDPIAVTNGYYGGGSGGRFGSYGSGSGVGGARGYTGGANGYKGNSGPDLRKFLPGGQYDPKRGISGMGGPDGITGPNSNIWQKIKNRYQVMSPSLLP